MFEIKDHLSYANPKLAVLSVDCDIFMDNSSIFHVLKYHRFFLFSLGASLTNCIIESISL